MARKYLVMDDLDKVVDLKRGDVIFVASDKTGISGVAMVEDVDYEKGIINLFDGISSTGRVFTGAFIPVCNFVCMASEVGKKRLSNAIDAMLDDRLKDMFEEIAKEEKGDIGDMNTDASDTLTIVESNGKGGFDVKNGTFVRCYDGIASFTAKVVDVSRWKEGEVKAMVPHENYVFEMIDIKWIVGIATEEEILIFEIGENKQSNKVAQELLENNAKEACARMKEQATSPEGIVKMFKCLGKKYVYPNGKLLKEDFHKITLNRNGRDPIKGNYDVKSGTYVRCHDGIATFTAKLIDLSRWEEGKVEAITPNKDYGFEMIELSWIICPATEEEIILFRNGMGF